MGTNILNSPSKDGNLPFGEKSTPTIKWMPNSMLLPFAHLVSTYLLFLPPLSHLTTLLKSRRRWLSGTILASVVLDSTGFWVRISARTPILRNITMGGDITGGFCPGAGFPSCHKSIYRVSEDNFRGSACVSEWMLIFVKDVKDGGGGLVFHNLRLHKDNKLE
jgi:hypothetical protein